jgi:hypothetical protein
MTQLLPFLDDEFIFSCRFRARGLCKPGPTEGSHTTVKRTLSRCDFRLRSTSRDFSCLVAVALALLFRGIATCEVTQQPTDERATTPNCPRDPRPSYQFPFLRYDEDWSFLRCAPRTDRWDRIKYFPLGEGKTYVTIGGDVREVYKAASQTFAAGTGEFQSNTIGGRWAGKTGNRDFDEEANVQVGTFKNADIRAWSAALYNGYTFEHIRETPRISLRS